MARWIRFARTASTGFGQIEGDQVRVFEGDLFAEPRPTDEVLPLSGLQWLTPVQPGKVIAMYNNFNALLQKMKLAPPAEPQYLLKPPNTFLPTGAPIPRPACDSRVVFEGELGIVIGRTCKAVSEAHAMSHVFGYTCANDVTAVDLLTRDPSFAHWARAKGFDGFCPFGPSVATDLKPENLIVRTTLNGSLRQDFPVSDMHFSVPQLVSALSHDMTLQPGDLILAGTSIGVGVLKPGSRVDVEIAGIGTLGNRFG
jgi:2-keto-4-pentenoate hydratase/2-oxohepta-3-ene-1,7-dioic acid hydratase in catechol pathway